MEPIITFVKANVGMASISGIILLAILIITWKKSAPIFYHCFEFIFYFTVCHYILWAGLAVSSWYANETDPSVLHDYHVPVNPLTQNFADKAAYAPVTVFYVEIAIFAALLYLVIVVRPTSYSGGVNQYKGDSERGMKGQRGRGAARYNRNRASANRK